LSAARPLKRGSAKLIVEGGPQAALSVFAVACQRLAANAGLAGKSFSSKPVPCDNECDAIRRCGRRQGHRTGTALYRRSLIDLVSEPTDDASVRDL